MDTHEVLDKISIAIADIEWTHDIGIAAALDVAMKRVKDWDRLKDDIKWLKQSMNSSNKDYANSFVCALSNVEGRMAEMENEDE
jgi:hypothetical protein